MPQWLILMSMSIALKGLGVKADQVVLSDKDRKLPRLRDLPEIFV